MKKRIFGFFVVMMGLAALAGAQSLTDVYNGHRGADFNGGWKFNLGDVSGAQNTTYNDASWRSLRLPHDWSIELAYNQSSASASGGGYLDGGVGWYRKTFTLPPTSTGQRVFIEFDGVYMDATVYINGTLLGTRPYGYSTFEYELTQYLNAGGSNVIAVRVNNNQPTTRWYSGSGIYRNVWLTTLNPVHIGNCGVSVSTPLVSSASATVAVNTVVQNQSTADAPVAVAVVIADAAGNTVVSAITAPANVTAASQSTISQNLTIASPQWWSPASPYRYRVKAVALVNGTAVDSFTAPLGFRTIGFDANAGFSLNGQSLKLHGIAMHHDFGCMGTAINRRIIERQLGVLKAMGCNAIRTSHNPPEPEFIDICDSLGIMVMEEAFDCWESAKNTNDYHLYFTQWGQSDIQGMVMRDRNHPAVILWSIGNEIVSPTVATAQNLRNWVRLIDTTRPVTWACNVGSNNNTSTQNVINVLDVAGYNYSNSLYRSNHSTYPARRIFASEACAARRSRSLFVFPDSQVFANLSPDVGSSYDNSLSTAGVISAENDWKANDTLAYIAGEFIWTGCDYLGECVWPSISHNTGIIDRCGFPKDIYYFYKSKWTADPVLHILPYWNWATGDQHYTATNGVNLDSSVISGIFNVPVWAYTNCDSVELFLNNQSLGVRRFQAGGALHLKWTVPFAAGTLKAVGMRGGVIAAIDSVRSAGTSSRVLVTVDRTVLAPDSTDLAFVTACIIDSNGVTNPRAANMVTFSITGPGAIVGVDNGNSLDLSSYKTNVRHAFNGKCIAVVQSGTTAGQITVTATSGTLTPGTVSIVVGGATEAVARGRATASIAASSEIIARVNESRFMLPSGTVFPAAIAIYSISGRLVRSWMAKTRTVSLGGDFRLPEGVYIVKILKNGAVVGRKR